MLLLWHQVSLKLSFLIKKEEQLTESESDQFVAQFWQENKVLAQHNSCHTEVLHH